MATLIICNKCGMTAEVSGPNYPIGWLVHQRKNAPQGHLVIRCPEHITGHSKRLAGLPQKSDSKRIKDNLDRGLWCNYGHPADDYSAAVRYDLGAVALDPDEVDDPDLGAYLISFHKGRMPAFNARRFHTLSDLIAAMRNVEPDLRKWRLTEA